MGTGASPRKQIALGTEPRHGSLWGPGVGTSVNGMIEQDAALLGWAAAAKSIQHRTTTSSSDCETDRQRNISQILDLHRILAGFGGPTARNQA